MFCRTEYGSAVLGRFISGRRIGRRTVPLIRDPVPVELFRADFVDSLDIADGGRGGPLEIVEVLDIVRAPAPRDLVDIDLGGEYVAAAEFGRSMIFLEAANFARLCSAIFSLRLVLAAPGPTDFENDDDTFICDDARDALGLFGSLSRPVFSRLSSVSYILRFKLAFTFVSTCMHKLTLQLFEATPKQTSSMCFDKLRALWDWHPSALSSGFCRSYPIPQNVRYETCAS